MYTQKILLSSIVGACVIGILSGCAPIFPAPTIERVIFTNTIESPRVYQYRVKSGDTLYAISRLHGISVDQIAQMNKIAEPYVIFPGQELVVDRQLVTVESTKSAGGSESNSVKTQALDSSISQSPQTVSQSQPASSGIKVTKLLRPPTKSVGATKDTPNTLASSNTTKESEQQKTPSPASTEIVASNAEIPDNLQPAKEETPPIAEPVVAETLSKSTPQKEEFSSSTKPAEAETPSFVARTEPTDSETGTSPAGDVDSLPSGWTWPVSASPTNSFGKDDGLNYYLNQGNKVVAAASGRVTYAGVALSDFKYMVLVKTPDEYVIQYDFNVALNVQENDLVTKGQDLVKIVNSGKGQHSATSDEYRKMFFAIWKKGVPQNPDKLIGKAKTSDI